ncbi:MAG: peroxide stress protein YaaA [Bacteroidales bacterium]|nr:peroxide stress protein YaaA [Bacteroidales bacterium]
MIILLSPAKSLDFERPLQTRIATIPEFIQQANKLASELQKYSISQLNELMGISNNLAMLNFGRFQNWYDDVNNPENKQAVRAFIGEAYRGLKAEEMTEEDLLYAQEHLRILSGLYGILRPLDAIQAYRLEMGTKIEIGEFKNLYRFWDNQITNSINNALGNSKTIVNLASNEYFKSINRKKLNANVITPEFKEYKNGVVKMITVYVKNARGQMTNFIIKNRIKDPEQIKTFDINGYQFDVNSSDEGRWVFVR